MRLMLALSAVALVSCAASSPPPVAPPPPPQPAPVEVSAAESYARAASQQVAAAEASRRELEEAQAGAVAAREADRREVIEAASARCAKSRHERAERLKWAIVARLKAETKLLKHSKAIRATCKLVDVKTGAVTVNASGGGLRVAPELADDVACSRPLPGGVTKNDAWVVLARVRESGNAEPAGRILDSDDLSDEDHECTPHDKAAGLDVDAIRFESPASYSSLEGF